MNVFTKFLNAAFSRIKDNPFYTTQHLSGGFTFDQFNLDNVINDGYAKNPDFYAIVKSISSTASTIPSKLYDIKADGEKELITDGELFDILQQPNRLQTIEEFKEEAIMYLLLSGNNYNVGHRAMGFGDVFRELNVLASNFVTIETGGVVDPIKAYLFQDTGNITFAAEDVMHVKYPNPKGQGSDRLIGMSPMQAGNTTLQSSNNIFDARGGIIKNQGVNGILTNESERGLRSEEAKELQSAWDKKNRKSGDFGKTLVTTARLNYLKMGMSPTDLKLIENGVEDLRTFCRIYNVPSQLFGDVAGTTFNNVNAAEKSYYNKGVLPSLDLWLRSFNNWFIADWSKHDKKNYSYERDISGIEVLQADQKLEAEKDKIKMEGVSTVLSMPISNEGKSLLLQNEYDYSEEEANIISINTNSNEDDR